MRVVSVEYWERMTRAHHTQRRGMEHLNAGYLQLGLFALLFGGLQIWWIGSTLRARRLARPMSAQEFRRSLERNWSAERPGPS